MTSFAHRIFLEKTFKHPVDKVFKAFHTVETLRQWWGPAHCRVGRAELDFEVGGQYRIELINRQNGQSFFVCGQFLEIVRDRLIKYSYFYEGLASPPFRSSQVTIHFSGIPDQGTLVEVIQEFAEVPARLEIRTEAWQSMLARLATIIS